MVESERIQALNDKESRDGKYVLYWMQQSQRAHFNPALEHAIQEANQRALPVLVPPWHRISSDVVQRLPQLGYSGLSTFADAFTAPQIEGLTVENSHLDLIDWRGTRGGRDHQELLDDLIELIEVRTPAGLPIGILSHHLVHDEVVWSFLDKLAGVLDGHPGAFWRQPSELFSA